MPDLQLIPVRRWPPRPSNASNLPTDRVRIVAKKSMVSGILSPRVSTNRSESVWETVPRIVVLRGAVMLPYSFYLVGAAGIIACLAVSAQDPATVSPEPARGISPAEGATSPTVADEVTAERSIRTLKASLRRPHGDLPNNRAVTHLAAVEPSSQYADGVRPWAMPPSGPEAAANWRLPFLSCGVFNDGPCCWIERCPSCREPHSILLGEGCAGFPYRP